MTEFRKIVFMSRPLGTQSLMYGYHGTAQYTMLLPFGRDTVQYTMLLPFGRDTVHCLYRVINGLTPLG